MGPCYFQNLNGSALIGRASQFCILPVDPPRIPTLRQTHFHWNDSLCNTLLSSVFYKGRYSVKQYILSYHRLTLWHSFGAHRGPKLPTSRFWPKASFQVLYRQVSNSTTRIWSQILIPYSTLCIAGLQSFPSGDHRWLRPKTTLSRNILVGVMSTWESIHCVYNKFTKFCTF